MAALPLPQSGCSPDTDSIWSASGTADGPINGDHSARRLFIYVTDMLIRSAHGGRVYGAEWRVCMADVAIQIKHYYNVQQSGHIEITSH